MCGCKDGNTIDFEPLKILHYIKPETKPTVVPQNKQGVVVSFDHFYWRRVCYDYETRMHEERD